MKGEIRETDRERRVISADRDGVICGGLTVGKSVRCRVSGEPKSLVNLEKDGGETDTDRWNGRLWQTRRKKEQVGCFQANIPQRTCTGD